MESFASRSHEWLEQERNVCVEELRRLSKKDSRRKSFADRFAALTREINKRSDR